MSTKLNFSSESFSTLIDSEFWEDAIFDNSIEVDINQSFGDIEVSDTVVLNQEEKEYDSNSSSRLRSSPLLFYLRQLGDAQIQAIERVYQVAVESMQCKPLATCDRSTKLYRPALDTVPCQSLTNCHNPLKDFTFTKCNESLEAEFNCAIPYFKNNKNKDVTPTGIGYDPFNRNIVGPKSCEFCHASSTLRCHGDCERPKLFFMKKRPPFENSEEWDPVTEYHIDDHDIDLNL